VIRSMKHAALGKGIFYGECGGGDAHHLLWIVIEPTESAVAFPCLSLIISLECL
jgi:hypothetical protein